MSDLEPDPAPSAPPEEVEDDAAADAVDDGAAGADGAPDVASAASDDASDTSGATTEDPSVDHGHATTVIVPIGNPDTAEDLLSIACAVAQSQDGRVIALSVVTGDAEVEANLEVVSEVKRIVAHYNDTHEGIEVSSLGRQASSIARGILDAVSQTGADLLVLGAAPPEPGRISLGKIVESVVDAAHCDVVVYRPGAGDIDHVRRVVVGLDGTDAGAEAARTAMRIADGLGAEVLAVGVQSDEAPPDLGRRLIERSLRDVPNTDAVTTAVARSEGIASGLLSRTRRRDLLVVGLPPRAPWRVGGLGRTTLALLERSVGPVVLVRRSGVVAGRAGHLQRALAWLHPRLTDVERETVMWRAGPNSSITLDFLMLSLLSSLLASFGLLLDSPAVVIGAMLIAPLMSPLSAFAVGLTTVDWRVVVQSARTVAAGFLSVLAVSLLVGLVSRIDAASTEMLARTQPGWLDLGVGLAAGLAGGYATARKDIPAALAGVAISAALVPPVCVVGLSLALGEWDFALGAFILFSANIISIAISAALVFWWLGLRTGPTLIARIAPAIAVAVALSVTAIAIIGPRPDPVSPAAVEEALILTIGTTASDVLVVWVRTDTERPRTVTAVVQTDGDVSPRDVALVEQSLRRQLGEEITLRIVVEQVIHAG